MPPSDPQPGAAEPVEPGDVVEVEGTGEELEVVDDPAPAEAPSTSEPAPGETPATEAPGAVPVTPPEVGGPDAHPEDPADPATQSPAPDVPPSQPTEGLGSPTPETTVDGEPATQQGTETGPAPGPSPDAGGATQP